MGKEFGAESNKRQLKKGQWTPEEDLLLKTYIETHGEGKWSTVSQRSGLMRAGKSCRMRWMNYLRPNLKHGAMSQDEEDLIIRMHKLLGNRWSLIAGRLPGRTDNEIKNYWHTHLGKRQQHLQPHHHQVITSTTTNNSSKCSKKRRFSSDSSPDHHHQTHDHQITTPINKDNQIWPCGNRSIENDNLSADEIEDAVNYVQNTDINGFNINNVLQCSKLLPGETAYYEEPFSPALNSVLLHYHSFGNNSNPSAHVDQYYSLAGDDGNSPPLLYLPEDFYSSMVLI